MDVVREDPLLDFAYEVEAGLSDRPMRIPCRFLYDARGSELFEQICDLPEYYLTRAEASILKRHSTTIQELTGSVSLVELGSGTSVKTDYLLSAYGADGERVRYVPVDVSESAMKIAAGGMKARHPRVVVEGIVGTYESAFPLFKEHSPAMVVFLGSTIGNFDRGDAELFWQRVEESLRPGDFFLLGADLVKDSAVLEAAYNDAAGVTAEFMKNLFVRMNRELGSDLDLDEIQHIAEYNSDERRVEIYANFKSDQEVAIEPLDRSVFLGAGDIVLLEVSCKFVLEDLIEYVSEFGLDTIRVFTDDEKRFADLLLQKR
jgi:L-histidine N-alpha-methyltransferase